MCPATYPYAYLGGSYCCSRKLDCNGVTLTPKSTCCMGNDNKVCSLTSGCYVGETLYTWFIFKWKELLKNWLLDIRKSKLWNLWQACTNFFSLSDRLQSIIGHFSTINTSNIGPYISRTMLHVYSTASLCLAECFFASTNDCHFAARIGTNCNIGTFQLWPIRNPPGYSTSNVYVFNGKITPHLGYIKFHKNYYLIVICYYLIMCNLSFIAFSHI